MKVPKPRYKLKSSLSPDQKEYQDKLKTVIADIKLKNKANWIENQSNSLCFKES